MAAKVRPLPDRCTPCAAARHSRTALRRHRNGRLSASAEQKAPVGAEVLNNVAGRVSDLASAVAGLENVDAEGNCSGVMVWTTRPGVVRAARPRLRRSSTTASAITSLDVWTCRPARSWMRPVRSSAHGSGGAATG